MNQILKSDWLVESFHHPLLKDIDSKSDLDSFHIIQKRMPPLSMERLSFIWKTLVLRTLATVRVNLPSPNLKTRLFHLPMKQWFGVRVPQQWWLKNLMMIWCIMFLILGMLLITYTTLVNSPSSSITFTENDQYLTKFQPQANVEDTALIAFEAFEKVENLRWGKTTIDHSTNPVLASTILQTRKEVFSCLEIIAENHPDTITRKKISTNAKNLDKNIHYRFNTEGKA